jgi:hypothetical protein
VPVLVAWVPSLTVTAAWLLVIVGAVLGLLSRTLTSSLLPLATARSCLPSPLKSPTATEAGALPAA